MTWLDAHMFMVIGVIWMLVLGPAVGNYACSVVYRLPRGKTPFERHPFCGHCNADLKPIDLFPIISWCLTRGKCRYCGGEIPAIYTVIEVVTGIVFITYFLHFGMGERFLLYTGYAVFTIILAAIHWQQGWLAGTIYSYAMGCVVLARTLAEHTVYGAVRSAVVMLTLMLLLRLFSKTKRSPFDTPWIWWFTLMGALLPIVYWKYILPVFVVKLFVPKQARVMVYAASALVLPLVIA